MELWMRHSLLKMYAYNNLHLESIAKALCFYSHCYPLNYFLSYKNNFQEKKKHKGDELLNYRFHEILLSSKTSKKHPA